MDLDEAVDGEPLLSRVVEDGELLVSQVLGTCRETQVGDGFHGPGYEKVQRPFNSTVMDHKL